MTSEFATKALTSIGTAALAYAIWKIVTTLVAPYRSSLRNLPGPPSVSWILGSFRKSGEENVPVLFEEWSRKYGATFSFQDWFNEYILYTEDTKAMNHVLNHAQTYAKSAEDTFYLGKIFGHGLLTVEGDQHKQQRRIVNPAFGPAQVRELTEIFVDKAQQLRDIWIDGASNPGSDEPSIIEVTSGLNKATLDAIGIAGFNYSFGALDPNSKPNELGEAFRALFQMMTGGGVSSIMLLLKFAIPILRIFPDGFDRESAAAQAVARRVGMQLIQEKKAEVLKAASGGVDSGDALRSRDLLTLLIKANMDTDVPEDRRLSDEDVLAQIPTFFIAGHETTSYGTAFGLFALAQAQGIQQKLREELLGVGTDTPTMDELNSLPYLDAVVREILRVHAPVLATGRTAMKDDILPLSIPYTDRHGRKHDHVKIDKGADVKIPIQAINSSKALWGDDAALFKPERWVQPPEAIQAIPGVWGNMMTFLGGPRACIGYRFALVEMKALLFTLIRAFVFELALPVEDIIKKTAIVQRPFVRDKVEQGSQLPLILKPYQRS
ncbi:cytochrome P450 [Daedalea quercina L-15889]|uniref:Cytochrome P450 n=1 Tax=Daedalea quercina L-15889 TaxID=1314783 RepID=A0A165RB20_9APHY|nr:cytochrome P450 [Daedalea quercina L-15889]